MKIFSKILISFVALVFAVSLTIPSSVFAATTPTLGAAASFGILASTYTNTVAGNIINGDLGYTTGPATAPTVNGTTHVADSTYNQAGIDQAAALSNLNSQACTFTFAPGPIDLASDTTHGPIGLYAPGVYCTTGAASIGAGTINLSGNGTYIFRISGALTTAANTSVILSGGASACDVFWTPTAATTLGANSTFVGTDIDASGITIGSTVTWTGRALAFSGTASTTTDTITVPTCTVTPPVAAPILHVVKVVVNNNGGTAVAAQFNLHVRLAGSEVSGSPAIGITLPGRSYTLAAGTYVVSEDANASYTQTFSGACNSGGTVTLAAGDNVTCTLTNDDVAAAVIPPVTPVPPVVPPPAAPGLPNTGVNPNSNNFSQTLPVFIFAGIVLIGAFVLRKQHSAV